MVMAMAQVVFLGLVTAQETVMPVEMATATATGLAGGLAAVMATAACTMPCPARVATMGAVLLL